MNLKTYVNIYANISEIKSHQLSACFPIFTVIFPTLKPWILFRQEDPHSLHGLPAGHPAQPGLQHSRLEEDNEVDTICEYVYIPILTASICIYIYNDLKQCAYTLAPLILGAVQVADIYIQVARHQATNRSSTPNFGKQMCVSRCRTEP